VAGFLDGASARVVPEAPMIRIAITQTAFDAIAATMRFGNVVLAAALKRTRK
jgi:hypothetical protein